MATYKVTTESGSYKVTTADSVAIQPPLTAPKEQWEKYYKETMVPQKKSLLETEVSAPLGHGLSAAAFGLPKSLAQKAGVAENMFPEQVTPAGKLLRFVSEAGGTVLGGAGKVATGVAAKMTNPLAKAVTVGAVGGGLQLTGTEKDKPILEDLKQQALQSVAGAAAGTAFRGAQKAFNTIIPAIKKIPTVLSPEKATKFAEDLRMKFVDLKKNAVSSFGKKLDKLVKNNNGAMHPIDDVVNGIRNNADDISPEAMNVFRKTPILKDMIAGNGSSFPVSVKDSQSIINYLNTKVPAKVRFNNLDLIEAIDDLRASQLDAFPEMAKIRASYAKTIDPYNKLKPYFKWNKTLSSVESGFGGSEGMAALRKSGLPASALKDIEAFKNAKKVLGAAKVAALVGGVAATGKYTLGKMAENIVPQPVR